MPPRARGIQRGGTKPSPASTGRTVSFASVARGSGGTGRGSVALSPAAPSSQQVGRLLPERHVETIGVKRSSFGTQGKVITIEVNLFQTTISNSLIWHYDVAMVPPERNLPQRVTMDLIKQLQKAFASDIFQSPVVYDGKKNIYSTRELPLGPTGSREFDVSLPERSDTETPSHHKPQVYRIRLNKVAVINPELLQGYIKGRQSYDPAVLTASQALNVVIRMMPMQTYPFNSRTFFTEVGKKPLKGGVELWRGYFQSVRPAIERILINIDISTGLMYQGGPLIHVALAFLGGGTNPHTLASLSPTDRLKLQRFLIGVRIETKLTGFPKGPTITRTIKGLTDVGAHEKRFITHDGSTITVAEYCARQNQPLQYPRLLCVEVGPKTSIPIELCKVPPGQLVRKQLPPDQINDVLRFATKRPRERLQTIKDGLQTLNYTNSAYVQQFGMRVDDVPLSVKARVLDPPKLVYGGGAVVTPENGSWKITNLKFFKPSRVTSWIIAYVDSPDCTQKAIQILTDNLTKTCEGAGMTFTSQPNRLRLNGQGDVLPRLRDECRRRSTKPSLIVVVLPENSNELYTTIKHFGDCEAGVATQCLKAKKCFRLKDNSYILNVALKINVKLGGINLIPQEASVPELSKGNCHTLVMGADVIHPAPGTEDRPSFTSLVANIDTNTATYSATTGVQTSRQEMIADLREMAKHLISCNIRNRRESQKDRRPISRIILYRDGVSEGQFQQVLTQELPELKAACKEMKIEPKITVIVVGKRHHVRLFPTEGGGDRSGNCPAGTVVDTDITHPTDFDFYLQSHSGILGTSRSAHYSVVHDENGFSPDSLQSLSFALCHVYARSTRSVSIPAPVYYADIVCSRAKNHYGTGLNLDLDYESNSSASQQTPSLEIYKRNFKPLHESHKLKMYFS